MRFYTCLTAALRQQNICIVLLLISMALGNTTEFVDMQMAQITLMCRVSTFYQCVKVYSTSSQIVMISGICRCAYRSLANLVEAKALSSLSYRSHLKGSYFQAHVICCYFLLQAHSFCMMFLHKVAAQYSLHTLLFFCCKLASSFVGTVLLRRKLRGSLSLHASLLFNVSQQLLFSFY